MSACGSSRILCSLRRALSVEELKAFFEEDYIEEAEQRETNEIYELMEVSVSGAVVLDPEKKTIDLSGLRAVAPAGILLEEGGTYVLTAALRSDFGLIPLASQKAVCTGEDLEITGFGDADPSALLRSEEGRYEMVLFFGKETESGVLRLSELMPAEGAAETSFTITEEESVGGIGYTYTLTAESSAEGIVLQIGVTEVSEGDPAPSDESAGK